MGSVKGNPLFRQFMDYYMDRPFILPNGEYDLTPNPVPLTNICQKEGLILNGVQQKLKNITIYSNHYFCPYNNARGNSDITENTYTIHYFNGSWIPEGKRKIVLKRKSVVKKYGKVIGYIKEAGFFLHK